MPERDEGAVSVIIPARNEELNIERVVRSIAPQQGLREMIVVDDASTDTTPEILAGLCREFPLLRTIRLDSLPEGWMGKSHAAAAGAELATGEWLLFTDADTEHLPGSLQAMLRARQGREGRSAFAFARAADRDLVGKVDHPLRVCATGRDFSL